VAQGFDRYTAADAVSPIMTEEIRVLYASFGHNSGASAPAVAAGEDDV